MAARNIIERIFPIKYHFYEMLDEQARINGSAVNALHEWLKNGSESESDKLLRYIRDANDVRMRLEKDLVEAFSTPFDRVDIYSVSVGMNEVIEYAGSTLLSMQAFRVKPNDVILGMVEKLKEGADIFADSVKSLEKDPSRSARNIPAMRDTHTAIEQLYRDGMAVVFETDDPMNALKQREVYHHIKDASSNLDKTVDILHRIVVRLT